ncbi:MAG TPA: WG repeat-containing protein [Bacteroidia bacterium]|jgi:hypothetical protein|nr:WG repeat-containing protein [Bacteroidia bacterium]
MKQILLFGLMFPFFACFSQDRKTYLLAPVQVPVHYGLVNLKGDTVLGAQFEELVPFTSSAQELTPAKLRNLWGYVNRKGIWVIPPRYENANAFEGDFAVVITSDSSGKNQVNSALLSKRGTTSWYGLIDNRGVWKVKPVWDKLILNGKGLWFKNKEELWGLMNLAEKVILSPRYVAVFPSGSGVAVVVKSEHPLRESAFALSEKELVTGGKWGLTNEQGIELVTPAYFYISPVQDGMAAFNAGGSWTSELYYWKEKNLQGGQWGFLDSTGKVAVQAGYESVKDFHDGVAFVKNKEEGFYINRKGQRVDGPPANRVELNNTDAEGRTRLFCLPALWGYTDTAGHRVISPAYQEAKQFSNGFAAVSRPAPCSVEGSRAGSDVDQQHFLRQMKRIEQGEIEPGFSKDLYSPTDTLGEHWGYITPDGKLTIGYQFEKAGSFSEGMAAVCLHEQWGFINTLGELVIEPQFDDDTQHPYSFDDGLAMVRKNGLWGFINKKGKQVIPAVYTGAKEFNEGLAAVKIGERWGYIDKTGKLIIPAVYSKAGFFVSGLASVAKSENDNGDSPLYGYIDPKGNWVIPPHFLYAQDFKEGLAVVQDEKVPDDPSRKYRYYQHYWGYIDKNGTQVIPCKYTFASDFEQGMAFVRIKDEGQYIDQSGSVLLAHISSEFGGEAPHKKYRMGFAVERDEHGRMGFKNKKRAWVVPPDYIQVIPFSSVYE